MQSASPFRAGSTLAPAVLLVLLAVTASAQERGATRTRSPEPAIEPTPGFRPSLGTQASVLYDEPGDGRLWAAGSSWKASFGADGATYYPRTVTTRSLPHALSPESVTIGDVPMAFERGAPAVRCGDRVEIDRGSFVEAYELGAQSLEQIFVFTSIPRTGELVLRIPLVARVDAGSDNGEMQLVGTDAGIELRSGMGCVTYSRAVAIDARGMRVEAATSAEDGSIVIRVAAEFLSQAAFPLVVDPVLNAIFPASTSSDEFSTDAAFDTFNSIWYFVYERVFSSTDHDVIARVYDAAGTDLGTTAIELAGQLWETPRIAYMRGPRNCLIVASVTHPGGSPEIYGRIIKLNGTSFALGATGILSTGSNLNGGQVRPDVGGVPFDQVGGTWFIVTWQNEPIFPGADRGIEYQLVGWQGGTQLAGPRVLPMVPGAADRFARVSKSNGGDEWLIAFQRTDGANNGDVYGVYVRYDGQLMQVPFPIFTGPGFEGPPSASSPIQFRGPFSSTSATDKYVVAWESGQSPDRDIRVAALLGTTVTQVVNLTALEHSGPQNADQIEASVDGDGTHFMVSYSEGNAGTGMYEVKVTDLALEGGALAIRQSHLTPLSGTGLSQRGSKILAARSITGPFAHRYLTTFDSLQSAQNRDVKGVFLDGVGGGSWVRFCFGDGSGAACPCGNTGALAQGCANSVFAVGGSLGAVAGTPTATDVSVVLQADTLPPGAPCLFFQGTNAGAGGVLGDGLRCATGSVTRLSTGKTANGGGTVIYPAIGEQPLVVQGSVPAQGGMRTYQVWYRNAPVFCTASTFNLTNGFQIFWAP